MMPHRSEPPATSPRTIALAATVLVLAVLAAYSNSFSGPFIYDDKPAIADNLTLRHLWPPWAALSPPHGGLTVDGRPVLNLSLAINYAFGGAEVGGYHAVNLLIHALAALALFGLVRRTLLQPALRARFGPAALPVAFVTAALWALHPLQTEAVSYLVQRAESLMGLFYLLTLYAFVRSVQAASPGPWPALSIVACLLGVGTKEVIVTAPVLVLLYDRTFVAGTFRDAWQQRRRYYFALVCTWIPLAWLVAGAGGNRGGSMGFGIGMPWTAHALTQFEAIARYLKLSFWPHPLVFDYGAYQPAPLVATIPYAVVVALVAAVTAFALWRRPVVGFLGAWFLAILAPTSAMPQLVQIVVEHRMYLPLAAVVALIGPGIYLLGGRRGLVCLLAAAAALGALTFRRNVAYRTEIAIWQDTVAKRPANSPAGAMLHGALGNAFAAADRTPEAIAEFETALRLQPDDADALASLGNSLTAAGRLDEAVARLTAALRLKPALAEAHLNLGVALDRLGRSEDALPHYETALRFKPALAPAHVALGDALLRRGQTPAALAQLQEALRLDPRDALAHYTLALALLQADRAPEASAEFDTGLRLKPNDVVARDNWSNALLRAGRLPDALAQYAATLRLRPESPPTHYNYGNALSAATRYAEAAEQYAEAVRLKPDYAEAHNNWGNALALLGRTDEAIARYERSLQLKPANPSAHNNLGLALARTGRLREAAVHFAAAVQIAPDYREARENLLHAQAALSDSPPKN